MKRAFALLVLGLVMMAVAPQAFQKDVNGKKGIVQLLVPDRNNVLGDVVLGYDTLDQYMAGRASMGAIVGRYANRIAQGRWS